MSSTRADYGYLGPVIKELRNDPEIELQVIASGTHLSKQYGMTVRDLEADGAPIAARIEIGSEGGSPSSIAAATAKAMGAFADAYERLQPSMLLLLGDRYEILAAAMALLPFARPIAHIAGGESTQGAIDEGVRHALTKLSHLHFVATAEYARRVIQMGEEPWRVTVSGAPTLDNLATMPDLTDRELEALIGMKLDAQPLLATFHPLTLSPDESRTQIAALLDALRRIDVPVVFTYPNADTNARDIIEAVERFVSDQPSTRSITSSLGTRGYFALMRRARLMVGNSSSGIIEAASFKLPVVNVGDRQLGRAHGANVLHVACEAAAIERGIRQALSAEFRTVARQVSNPYGDGHAAERIADVLRTVSLDERLLRKSFHIV